MADSEDNRKGPINLFSLIPKFPFFSQPKPQPQPQPQPQSDEQTTGERESDFEGQNPNFVRFPITNPLVSVPLGVEVEESSARSHNPIVIWQVYALGGFIILKWVWSRWKERNERAKKASSDDDQSSDEYQVPADDNE